MLLQLSKDFEKDPQQDTTTLPKVPGAAAAAAYAAGGGGGGAAAGGVVDAGAAVSDALVKISKHKVGGDGGKCLKLLQLYLKNVVEKPEEGKYRSIKCGDAFKLKVIVG